MRVDRLKRLQEELAKPLPANVLFDMSWWSKKHNCGTTYCAGGLACLIPEFQAEGLMLIPDGWGGGGSVMFAGHGTSFDALADFFELTDFQFEMIFVATHYPEYKGISSDIGMEDVIRQIQRVIDGV